MNAHSILNGGICGALYIYYQQYLHRCFSKIVCFWLLKVNAKELISIWNSYLMRREIIFFYIFLFAVAEGHFGQIECFSNCVGFFAKFKFVFYLQKEI